MEKEFVPYLLALELWEIGFDEPCFGYYDHQIKELDTISSEVCERLCKHNTHIKAPTFQQVFRWFDYSTDWSGFIVPSKEEGCFDWWIQNYEDPNYLTIESDDWYRGREEAELECLKKLIEIVKEK